MIRLLSAAAAAAAIALAPLTAAAASPSPSPSLDSVLAKPPTADFAELTSATFHGEFTAHDWAINASGVSPTQTESSLNNAGFVDGYGKTWTSTSTQHVLLEVVMAFSGGKGAKSTLTAIERSDKADPHYQHADTLSGVDNSYGVHYVDASKGVYEDGYGFVKGNDLFEVFVAATKDDTLTQATNQARAQFDAAPDSTIPTSQWPENQSSNSAAFSVGAALGSILVGVLILAVIAVVVGLVVRSRRRPMAPAYGMPGMAAAPAVQMSPDGNYWYDGQGWRDASREVPPTAQRSSDGTLWWDGRTWRQVPQPGDPQAPTS